MCKIAIIIENEISIIEKFNHAQVCEKKYKNSWKEINIPIFCKI